MSPDVIFAALVGVLAALAVIGELVFALVSEWCAIQAPWPPTESRPSRPSRCGVTAAPTNLERRP